MTNSHRRFHRRAPPDAAAGTNVKTVNVEVVATVDTAGNVVVETTVTQPDSAAPTDAAPVTPITDATDVSAPTAAPEPSVPAAAVDVAASTPEVPSIASLPAETQSAVPSTPSEPSQPAVPSVAAVPTVASEPVLPSVPSVPAVPSVSLPSVPAVPPFPSTLTVPAYPFFTPDASDVVANAAAVSSASGSVATMEPSVVAALTVADTTNSTMSSISSISSSTSMSSSILASSPTLLSTMSGFSYMSSPVVMVASVTATSASESSQPDSSPSTTGTGSSVRATPTESLDAAGSSSFYGEGGPGWIGGGASATGGGSSAATNAAAAGDSDDAGPTAPLDTPQVVGSVVGSLAGAALILAIILMLLRRHKRRQGGALQLTDSHPTDREQAMRQVQQAQAVQQVRAPAPARASLVPSAFLNRFSGLSKLTAETSSPTERSFQRVSGRKLPSAFSEGMTSDQFARGGHMSDSSFYQDDQGTYGGSGMNKEYGGGFEKEIGEPSFAAAAGKPSVRPSPARTPVIHHPDNNPFDDTNRTLSPPMSPNPFSDPPLRGALGRSLHSADGSRSSRFTENV